jgi:hypothetical protein
MSPTADAAFVSRLGASKLAVKLGVKLVVNPVVKLEVLLDMTPTAKAILAIWQDVAVLAPLRLIHL